jgi:hypothetical protein
MSHVENIRIKAFTMNYILKSTTKKNGQPVIDTYKRVYFEDKIDRRKNSTSKRIFT